MKWIDEKGRLFGRINFVDFAVLLLVVIIGAVMVVKLLPIGKEAEVEEEETYPLVYTVRVTEVTQETYESILPFVNRARGKKDQLMANGQMVDGYIVDVQASKHIPTPSDTVGGETLDLIFTVEADVEDPVINRVGTQEVRIGKSHILKTVHLEFERSTILTCSWAKGTEKADE